MYYWGKKIKQATGPTVKKTAQPKSKTGEIITDGKKQMERWVELPGVVLN